MIHSPDAAAELRRLQAALIAAPREDYDTAHITAWDEINREWLAQLPSPARDAIKWINNHLDNHLSNDVGEIVCTDPDIGTWFVDNANVPQWKEDHTGGRSYPSHWIPGSNDHAWRVAYTRQPDTLRIGCMNCHLKYPKQLVGASAGIVYDWYQRGVTEFSRMPHRISLIPYSDSSPYRSKLILKSGFPECDGDMYHSVGINAESIVYNDSLHIPQVDGTVIKMPANTPDYYWKKVLQCRFCQHQFEVPYTSWNPTRIVRKTAFLKNTYSSSAAPIRERPTQP